MRHARLGGCVAAAMLMVAVAAPGDEICLGDCDRDGVVQVNDLVRCVDDALRSGPPVCPFCDLDGDGEVAINEIIAVLNMALEGCRPGPTGSPPPTRTPIPSPCGNGAVDAAGEECDDGNLAGGDGCAANCTVERRRTGVLDPSMSLATVQTEPFRVNLDRLAGTMVFTTGAARATAVRGPDGEPLFQPGEIPVVIRAGDMRFEPIAIPGSRCACVRGIEAVELGAGNVARGVIACGAPLFDVDAAMTIDHNTTPGSPGNSGAGAGLPDDPECDDCFEIEPGVRSCACDELGAGCAARHAGVCNSPRLVTRAGGESAPGAAVLLLRIAIGLLSDAGTCAERRRRDGSCLYADYGPDCLPCTDDDATVGLANLVVATTGTAEASVLDANNAPGNAIAASRSCSGESCRVTVGGRPFDCTRLAAEPAGGLGGGALATCFPGIDTDPLADTVTCARLATE